MNSIEREKWLELYREVNNEIEIIGKFKSLANNDRRFGAHQGIKSLIRLRDKIADYLI